MSIVDSLDKLTPEELESVSRLINKFANRHSEDSVEQPLPTPNKKRKRGKKQKEVDNTSESLIIEHGAGRSQPRTRVVLDEADPAPSRRSRGRGRTEPRKPKGQQRNNVRRGNNRDRGGGGVMARTESVRLSNQNKFLNMRERNAEKGDTQIDKKLWENRTPTERPEEYEDIEVQCRECGLWFDINPGLVLIDADTRQPNFVCNNCAPRGR